MKGFKKLSRVAGLFLLLIASLIQSSCGSGETEERNVKKAIQVLCIKPDHISETQMNADVDTYYNYWKTTYVNQSNGNTPGGGYYVKADSTGGHSYPIKSNSEAHGYGMLTFALMGDQSYFDGMYNMFDKHRSTINTNNMSWVITEEEHAYQDSDSATDGDMDIAYALLLAHDRWGSAGSVDYLSKAKQLITDGIKAGDMGAQSHRTKLGDWDSDQYSTRASDWMAGHMRAYYAATNDVFWNSAADTVYSLIGQLSTNYSPNTGLMPDFIVDSTPKPADPGFLEGDNDGDYYYNSCRYPFRIAVDYAHNGTAGAKLALNRTLSWLKSKTNNNPANIKAGYSLSGDVLSGSDYFTTAFASPFIAACVVDSAHQQYLNDGWDLIKNDKSGYYGDSINLLCMLHISGKWKAPGSGPGPDPDPNIALGKPVTVSSVETSSFAGSNAVDGNAASRWASQEGNDPEWIAVDLGKLYDITKITLKWEDAFAKHYSIETSHDNAAWTQVFEESNGNGGNDDITLSVTGRYIRLTGTERGTPYGYSLFEFEAYGTDAQPSDHTLTVTTDSHGTVALNPSGGAYANGTVVTLTATGNSGWLFDHWENDLSGSSNPASVTMDSDKTVKAVFREDTAPDVNIALNKPVTVSSVEGSAFTGSLAVDGDVNTRWASVEGHDPEWIAIDLGKIYDITKIVLNWEAAFASHYIVETSYDGSSWTQVLEETSGNGGSEDISLTATARHIRLTGLARGTSYGYSLFEFEVYGTEAQQPADYTLTVTTDTHGTVVLSPGGGTYPDGTVVTLTAAGNTGWVFDHWENDLSGSVNPASVTMDSDKTVKAVFRQDTATYYTVTVLPDTNGTVSLSPSGGTYADGTVVTLTATGNTGWVFDHWENDMSGNTNPDDITVDSDKTVKAVFVEEVNQPWKFIVYGDTRSEDDDHRSVLRSIKNNTPDYQFIMNVGDVVEDGEQTDQWETWQDACNDELGGTGQDSVPPEYMSCVGNHDDGGDPNWKQYLSGQNKLYGNDGTFFTVDYENVRIVVLNTEDPDSPEQLAMLNKAINENPKTWLFTIWHKPIFAFGSKSYQGDLHQKWGVPLYNGGADIMFMGHAHYYVRSKKLELNGDKNPPLDPVNGTAHIVTGTGGASRDDVEPDTDGNDYMVDGYSSDLSYTELTVNGNKLELRQIDTDGKVIDTATYTANPKTGVNPGNNIALNKTVSVSSVEDNTFSGSNAVDGNYSTRWASVEGNDPEWILIDLEKTYDITGSRLNWEAAFAKKYIMETSMDSVSWTQVYEETNGNGGIDTIDLDVTARYIKLTGQERGSAYGYSLFEFEVYGTENSNGNNALDVFNIPELYPSAQPERAWDSRHWANGQQRDLSSHGRDADDPKNWTQMRGSGNYTIDGNGILELGGSQPRIYITGYTYNGSTLDESIPPEVFWKNVEVTVYYKRSGTDGENWGGLVMGTRSGPDGHTSHSYCSASTYYARMRHDGKWDFEKELTHPDAEYWGTALHQHGELWGGNPLPSDRWIGMKFVIYNLNQDDVKMQYYYDKTSGGDPALISDKSNWEKIGELTDNGNWPVSVKADCVGTEYIDAGRVDNGKSTQVITDGGGVVFIRNTGAAKAEYKWLTIREVSTP